MDHDPTLAPHEAVLADLYAKAGDTPSRFPRRRRKHKRRPKRKPQPTDLHIPARERKSTLRKIAQARREQSKVDRDLTGWQFGDPIKPNWRPEDRREPGL